MKNRSAHARPRWRAFLIAHYLARAKVRLLLERRRIFSAIDDAVAEEGWKIVALLRLSPFSPPER